MINALFIPVGDTSIEVNWTGPANRKVIEALLPFCTDDRSTETTEPMPAVPPDCPAEDGDRREDEPVCRGFGIRLDDGSFREVGLHQFLDQITYVTVNGAPVLSLAKNQKVNRCVVGLEDQKTTGMDYDGTRIEVI